MECLSLVYVCVCMCARAHTHTHVLAALCPRLPAPTCKGSIFVLIFREKKNQAGISASVELQIATADTSG